MIDFESDKFLKDIKTKKIKLSQISQNLKAKFIGIDDVIDKVIKYIEVWYIFPEVLTRPLIINLFGMTGVGKTDLVRSLVKELGITNKFCEIQLSKNGYDSNFNDCDSFNAYDNNTTIKQCLTSSTIYSGDSGVLLLDEIQKYRTVSEDGSYDAPSSYKDLWTLLSDGKYPSMAGKYYDFLNDYWSVINRKKKKRVTDNDLISFYEATKFLKMFGSKFSLDELLSSTRTEFYNKIIKEVKNNKNNIHKDDDYSKLLIFISGNIDEAYQMAFDVADTDHDPDIIHDLTKKISIIDIKEALLKRFKPEEISRFGNIHIIYPSFNKQSFIDLINLKLKNITIDIKSKYNIDIIFDQSVNSVIYNNGVYPTQGTRPLFSTISMIVESNIPNIIYSCALSKYKKISISSNDNKLICNINNNIIEYPIECDIDKIAKNVNIYKRYINSVHEAGHVLLHCLLFNCAPKIVKSVTNNSNGYCDQTNIQFCKDNLLSYIKIGFGGIVSEELIFGINKVTVGSEADLHHVTSNLATAIRKDGIFNQSGVYTHPNKNDKSDESITDINSTNNLIVTILDKCRSEALELLKKHKHILIAIIDSLLEKNTLVDTDIINIFRKFNIQLENKDFIVDDYKLLYNEFKIKNNKE